MSGRRTDSNDDMLMLHALLDGELDAASALALEHRIAADPDLAAAHARLLALRGVVRGSLAREEAPAALRARVGALAGIIDAADSAAGGSNVVAFPQPAPRRTPTRSWRRIAASVAAAVVVLIGADAYLRSAGWIGTGDAIEQAAVAGHMRAVLSGQPVDVVSTDRHTVKPWLAAKVPLATAVVDLSAQGYRLEGGRVDIVGGQPAATLVYRYREHLISVTELAPVSASASPPTQTSLSGHPVVSWSDGARRYIAVSDMQPNELDAFVAAFRQAAASAGEGAGRT